MTDPLSKVKAGLMSNNDRPVPLKSVHIRAQLMDMASQVSELLSQLPVVFLFHLLLDIDLLKNMTDPLSKVKAGLMSNNDRPVPLKSVHIRAQLMDMASQVSELLSQLPVVFYGKCSKPCIIYKYL